MNLSVIITCYNEADYIGSAIESVLNQTIFDVISEIIIVDDGSTDNSSQIISKYSGRNKLIKYIYQENQGLAVARNTAIEAAKGEYIAILDGDDMWLENKVEKQAKFLTKHKDIGLLYSDFYVFSGNEEKRTIRTRHYDYREKNVLKKLFLYGGPIVPSTTIIKRECFDKLGLFDPVLRRAQDTDMWLRITSKYKIHHIDEPLLMRRIHSSSLSADFDKKREFLFYVTEKIVEHIPELAKYKTRRIAMLNRRTAIKKLKVGQRRDAQRKLISSIKDSPIQLTAYLYLGLSVLPMPMHLFKMLFKRISFLKKYT